MRALHEVDLLPADCAAIREAARALRQHFPVTRIVLFGSKATGDDDPESDIDILVLTSCPADTKLSDRISDQLFEIDLAYDVVLSELVVSEAEWERGLIASMPIHREVRDKGCLV